LSVGYGLLRQVVVDNQSVHSVVSEVLSDGASRVGSQELKRSCIRCSGSNNDGVSKSTVVFKDLHNVGHSGPLLSNGDVNAVESLGSITSSLKERLLVEDGVNSNGRLASLSISDDQLTLTSSNGNLFNN
jgi:hypothetical protein